MKVLALPRPLIRVISLLFLGVPISAFELILATHASWWRLPMAGLAIVSGATLILVLVLAIGLAKGKAWASWATIGLAGLWSGGTAFAAGKLGMTSLGFLAIFLVFYWTIVLLSLRSGMRKSYFDPGIRWFEGMPRPISFLSCEVHSDEAAVPGRFRVSRLDREGAFVFADGDAGKEMENLLAAGTRDARDLVFRFRDRQVRCRGVPMRYFKRGASGTGFRFQGLTLDTRKQLGDFIETLRGGGYIE